jgi:hypothetical protein
LSRSERGPPWKLVGGDGAQQRLDARDGREREHGDDESAPLGRGFELDESERLRQVDARDVHLHAQRQNGPDDDGDQRPRHRPETRPRQVLPEDEHGDGHDAEDRGRRTDRRQPGRQGEKVSEG